MPVPDFPNAIHRLLFDDRDCGMSPARRGAHVKVVFGQRPWSSPAETNSAAKYPNWYQPQQGASFTSKFLEVKLLDVDVLPTGPTMKNADLHLTVLVPRAKSGLSEVNLLDVRKQICSIPLVASI